jgi:hypothetical protein
VSLEQSCGILHHTELSFMGHDWCKALRHQVAHFINVLPVKDLLGCLVLLMLGRVSKHADVIAVNDNKSPPGVRAALQEARMMQSAWSTPLHLRTERLSTVQQSQLGTSQNQSAAAPERIVTTAIRPANTQPVVQFSS